VPNEEFYQPMIINARTIGEFTSFSSTIFILLPGLSLDHLHVLPLCEFEKLWLVEVEATLYLSRSRPWFEIPDIFIFFFSA
jgi:hypothetical protein